MTKLLPTFLCLGVYIHWLRLYRFYTTATTAASAAVVASTSSIPSSFFGGGPSVLSSAQELLSASRHAAQTRGEPFVHPYDRHAQMIGLEVLAAVVYFGTIWCAARWTTTTTATNARKGKKACMDESTSNASSSALDSTFSPVASSSPSSSSAAGVAVVSRLPLLSSLLVSSFGRFLLVLPLVWSPEYTHIDQVVRGIKLFVWASHVQACAVHLQVTTARATALVAAGVAAQIACCWVVYTFGDAALLPPQLWV